ncbi:MAG: SpoIIE family protein phosphatase [Leptospiraceae bacterium]|nr:SpoIIE family protein phosphatase [Leptospiraceae bacterium]
MLRIASLLALIIVFCLCGGLFAQPSQLSKPEIQEVFNNRVTVLDSSAVGNWYVRFSPPEEFLFSEFRSQDWNQAQVPGGLAGIPGYNEKTREMLYAKRFYLKELPQHSMSLRLGRIDDRDRVYLNGQKIGETGKWDAIKPQGYDRIRLYEIPAGLLRQGENRILVQVQGYFHGESGMAQGRMEIGPTVDLLTELRDDIYREILVLAIYFTAGSYFLFLFLRRRQNRENLLFALFIYGMVLRQLIRTELRFETDLEFFTIKRIEFCLTYSLFPVFFYFVRSFFRPDRTTYVRFLDYAGMLLSVASLGLVMHVLFFDEVRTWWWAQKTIGQPIWGLFILGSVLIQFRAAFSGNRDGIFMLAGTFFVVLGVLVDIGVSRGILHIPHLFAFFFSAFIMSLALILANRFVRLYRTVEDLNKNLERKVDQRTRELNETLNQVQSLKEKQDGDYFLTSLLMNPLGGNWASGDTVTFDSVVRQKKTFRFRKWDSEIGGDLVAIYDLFLQGIKYTVFMNADAMGKSMQGAGGAIVAGTVFKSMVTRLQVLEDEGQKSPEQWLHQCFQELQSVFLGFDGHMLVSAVIGLVDENGLLYYTNAEHPVSVLYRAGKASPLEDKDYATRKLGVHMVGVSFRVLVHRLRPGDTVIIGSDGRDDLLLGQTREGNRVINEDETLFLRSVERADGNLVRLCEELESRGELTDDLSLISLRYDADTSTVQEDRLPQDIVDLINTDPAEAHKRLLAIGYPGPAKERTLARLAARLKRHLEAEQRWKEYVKTYPEDSSAFFSLALICRLNGNLQEAIEYGERCRLRLPEHARNLANLADAYRLMGRTDRARELVHQALSVQSDLQPARQLLQILG